MTTIRFFQTHDAAGAPASQETLVVVPEKRYSHRATTAVRYLLPFQPRLSGQPGSYFYNRPGFGAGWFRVEGLRPFEEETLHQLLIVEDISLAIGIPERWREDPPLTRNNAPRAGNPWFLLVAAVVLLALAIFPWVGPVQNSEDPAFIIVCAVMSFVFVPLAIIAGTRALMRMRWWNAARAEARRRGIQYPDKLAVTGS